MRKSSRKSKGSVDQPIIALLLLLVLGGALLFSSAAFGLIARGTPGMTSVVFSHLVLGIGLGTIALIIMASVDYHVWQKMSVYFFAFSLLLTTAVFLPFIGLSHGGGRRWIQLFHISFQPSELLKLAAIMFASYYFTKIHKNISSFKYGLGGLVLILTGPILILVLQPDIGTLGVICIAVVSIFWTSGARMREVGILFVGGLLSLALLATFKPYIRDRIVTFIHPTHEQQAQGYQIKQSLIAIGSGGITGRGFGKGIQKFTYLPEPMGDSIFAVLGEELGFVGSVIFVLLFLFFALRGYVIASRAPDLFGSLMAVGIATYLSIEAFINIASMLGVAPLTGIPLTFISQGGSAVLISLLSAGILINISRQKTRQKTL